MNQLSQSVRTASGSDRIKCCLDGPHDAVAMPCEDSPDPVATARGSDTALAHARATASLRISSHTDQSIAPDHYHKQSAT